MNGLANPEDSHHRMEVCYRMARVYVGPRVPAEHRDRVLTEALTSALRVIEDDDSVEQVRSKVALASKRAIADYHRRMR